MNSCDEKKLLEIMKQLPSWMESLRVQTASGLASGFVKAVERLLAAHKSDLDSLAEKTAAERKDTKQRLQEFSEGLLTAKKMLAAKAPVIVSLHATAMEHAASVVKRLGVLAIEEAMRHIMMTGRTTSLLKLASSI